MGLVFFLLGTLLVLGSCASYSSSSQAAFSLIDPSTSRTIEAQIPDPHSGSFLMVMGLVETLTAGGLISPTVADSLSGLSQVFVVHDGTQWIALGTGSVNRTALSFGLLFSGLPYQRYELPTGPVTQWQLTEGLWFSSPRHGMVLVSNGSLEKLLINFDSSGFTLDRHWGTIEQQAQGPVLEVKAGVAGLLTMAENAGVTLGDDLSGRRIAEQATELSVLWYQGDQGAIEPSLVLSPASERAQRSLPTTVKLALTSYRGSGQLPFGAEKALAAISPLLPAILDQLFFGGPLDGREAVAQLEDGEVVVYYREGTLDDLAQALGDLVVALLSTWF